MAFVDENGKITIDDQAAEVDKKNLRLSIEHMDNMLTYLEQIIAKSEGMSGQTSEAVREFAQDFKFNVQKMKDETQITIDYITKIVETYKAVDASLKKTIEGFGGGM